MLTIYLIAVGRLKEKWMVDGVAEYEKRMRQFCSFQIIQIPESRLSKNPSPKEMAQALEKEGEDILGKIPDRSKVVALCIEGKQISSEDLAKLFSDISLESSQVTFVIGSSHGLSEEVKKKADLRLSLSLMTFPHQLARVLLCEQIYRGQGINAGTKYHK